MPPLVLFGSIFSPKSLNLPQGETSMAPGLDSIRRYTVPEKLGNSFVSFLENIVHKRFHICWTGSNLQNPKSRTQGETSRSDPCTGQFMADLGKLGHFYMPYFVFIFWNCFVTVTVHIGTMLNLNPTWFARRLAAG